MLQQVFMLRENVRRVGGGRSFEPAFPRDLEFPLTNLILRPN